MEKVEITRTLLEKKPEDLTESEKFAVEHFKKVRNDQYDMLEKETGRIVDDCTVLCRYEKLPVPDYGWLRPVEKLCYALDAMNIEYKKYGVSVVLDQAKEKFGELRFYTHIETREIGFLGRIIRSIDAVANLIRKVDFGPKTVVDRERYNSVEWREITKEQFENQQDENGQPLRLRGKEIVVASSTSDVKNLTELENKIFLVSENNGYEYSYVLTHMPKTHTEYTKHRILFHILGLVNSLSYNLSRLYKEPRKQRVAATAMDNIVDELVGKAERECGERCQHCGVPFRDHFAEKCETQGWYAYVCEDCAKAVGSMYRKSGKYYIEGVEQPEPTHSKPVPAEKELKNA